MALWCHRDPFPSTPAHEASDLWVFIDLVCTAALCFRLPVRVQQQQLPMLPALDEHVLLQRPEFPYPRETLRPGRVVWAKVEGHDWWPAKIVRRRAVPREVRAHTPVDN